MTIDLDVSLVQESGIVQDETTSPLSNQNVNLHFGYNPPMVASIIRDVLRFLFETGAPDHLKYNSDPKLSNIAIDISFDNRQSSAEMSKPKIVIDRGPYSSSPIGITDSMTEGSFGGMESSTQSNRDEFLNLIQGNCSIRVVANQRGACEEIAFLVMSYIVWSRPLICNTLGFKNLAAPLSASPITPDKDDREKYAVELNIPYSTEMRWMSKELGVKLKGFLLNVIK